MMVCVCVDIYIYMLHIANLYIMLLFDTAHQFNDYVRLLSDARHTEFKLTGH